MAYCIINFYKFIELNDLENLHIQHLAKIKELNINGTVCLAEEGINASLSGLKDKVNEYIRFLHADRRFSDIKVKFSYGNVNPLNKQQVKIKDRILVFDNNYQSTVEEIQRGKRLSPHEVSNLIKHKPSDWIIVDTRNYYEADYGTFDHAETLPIRHFKQFPKAFLERYSENKDKNFLFFCTGGIRCEKVVPFAEKAGFKNSYQLDGGILNYFEAIGNEGFHGSCFVFDNRWAINTDLKQSECGPHPDQISHKKRITLKG